MKPVTTILTPTGMLGYGYPESDFWAAVERGVDVLVADSGSTDPGPYMLGLGATLCSDESYARDLRWMLQAVHRNRIPLLISSAGGAGTRDQVDHMVALIDRIAAEEGFGLRVAAIYADVPAGAVTAKLATGRIEPNVRGDLPSSEAVEASAAIVAQMGAAPFTAILEGDQPFDVIVAGRAYDPAPHAAWSMHHGVAPSLAWHSGKLLECGGVCAEPKGGGVIATMYTDAFEMTPMSPGQACTPLSVAAHTLYEKSRPDLLPGPDGVLDISDCTYTVVDERTVRVSGSRHLHPERATVKLEGATIAGYRTVFIGGIHDPILIGQLDDFLATVEQHAAGLHPDLASGTARLDFTVYGRDAVMGELEPSTATPHEVGVLGQITAPTQEMAKAICSTVRIWTLHLPYKGQLATAGNLALPLNPMDNAIGEVCEFSIYHVMDVGGDDLFPVTRTEVGIR